MLCSPELSARVCSDGLWRRFPLGPWPAAARELSLARISELAHYANNSRHALFAFFKNLSGRNVFIKL